MQKNAKEVMEDYNKWLSNMKNAIQYQQEILEE